MNEKKYHLAQLNVAQLKEPLDAPATKDFKDGLEPINALAEKSPGFVWRLKDDEMANATNFRPFENDEMMIVNMSVWEDLESMKEFAFKTAHVEYIKRRFEWFERMKEAYLVMWWIPIGHKPDIFEAKARLKFLRKHGDTQKAFSFKKVFSQPS